MTIGLPIEFDIDVDTAAGVEDWGNDNVIPDGKDIDTWDDIEHKK